MPFATRKYSLIPLNAKSINENYMDAVPSGQLWAHQASLPKLPVPTLEETCSKYLQTLKPLLNDVEYEQNRRAVEEFLAPNGVGRVLQERLVEKAKNAKTSWLINWWNEYAYLAYRDPVVIYVSYFFQFVDDHRPQFRTQTGRAASLIQGAMEFRRLLLK
ncbi:Acyltransferase ChoActase/COT/CPT domain-containing protein [Rozella allomycis CSF55]|uniref:Acyltransferase ChoActase/COT/CPT domain-containing protein n=1 Tax=Rozella allomycis (strain CSF55) TaxID=988480 RepID=A0A075B4Z0_ROZAC|nr:Acyltransferase ChoActase/COT/CPT domain-containing protein [Rozella allomycis CSF55]|eukprot:EPZ36771.1 Acyltransferase ChoActase/COT/CPT domain-containing protein [Rozella allomycis CSF55]